MQRVIHFEVTADDPERAVKFYEQVFGWKTQRWGCGAPFDKLRAVSGVEPQTYWLMTTGANDQPGINGGIMRRVEGFPGTINTIGVASVEAFSKKVIAAGGKVVRPKRAIPGVGYQAYCLDSEGNFFGIHQSDPSAK